MRVSPAMGEMMVMVLDGMIDWMTQDETVSPACTTEYWPEAAAGVLDVIVAIQETGTTKDLAALRETWASVEWSKTKRLVVDALNPEQVRLAVITLGIYDLCASGGNFDPYGCSGIPVQSGIALDKRINELRAWLTEWLAASIVDKIGVLAGRAG